MVEDIATECVICFNPYERKNRPPVMWWCCKQLTCKSCGENHIRNADKGACACPFCRSPSSYHSFGYPDAFFLNELFSKVDVPIRRMNVVGIPLRCSHCTAEQISLEKLFIYFYQPDVIVEHALLGNRIDFLLQNTVCRLCLMKSRPILGAPILSLSEILFVEEGELISHSENFIEGNMECVSEASAMSGAVLCWRWLFSLKFNKVCDDYASTFVKIFLNSTFGNSLSRAPDMWVLAISMCAAYILIILTKKYFKNHRSDLGFARTLFDRAIDMCKVFKSVPSATGLWGEYLAQEVFYPIFSETLAISTDETVEAVQQRFAIMNELIDFECGLNGPDVFASIWLMLHKEFSRCAAFGRADVVQFVKESINGTLTHFFNCLRKDINEAQNR